MGKSTMSRRWRVRGAHSRGASAVEYALIVALVAAAVVLVSIALTRAASGAFSATAADVGVPPSDSVSGLVTSSPPAYTPPPSPTTTSATPTTTSATPTTTSATPTTTSATPTPTPTPTQPTGTTAVAPGASTTSIPVNPALATGYTYVANPACTFVPALLPAGATLAPTPVNTGQGNTLTTVGMVFAAPANATHYQAITATCSFKSGNSTVTATFSIWIS